MKSKLGKYNNKFNIDVMWNFGGFVLAGLIFVVINAVLLKVYGKEVVGVFNLVFATYMLLAQLAVAGIHLSVQVFIPKYLKVKRHADTILTASLITTLGFSTFITLLAYLFHEEISTLLNSDNVREAFIYVLWGLVFFSLNKVLLAYHNGYRRMKAFAVFQFLRVCAMMGVLIFFILFTENTNYLPSLLAIAEGLLFIVLFIYTLKYYKPSFGKRTRKWIKIHFLYGMRALPGNFFLDANARIDVLMLGMFLDEGRVGVYAFALNFVDGMMQIPMIFRNNINPIITKARTKSGHQEIITKLLKQNKLAFFKLITPLSILSILVFPVGLWILGIEEFTNDYLLVYGILVGAMSLVSGYLPFQMLFNQLGMPGTHSLFVFFIFLTNTIGNLIFIPHYGIYGAAIGTALATFAQAILLAILVRKYTPYKI